MNSLDREAGPRRPIGRIGLLDALAIAGEKIAALIVGRSSRTAEAPIRRRNQRRSLAVERIDVGGDPEFDRTTRRAAAIRNRRRTSAMTGHVWPPAAGARDLVLRPRPCASAHATFRLRSEGICDGEHAPPAPAGRPVAGSAGRGRAGNAAPRCRTRDRSGALGDQPAMSARTNYRLRDKGARMGQHGVRGVDAHEARAPGKRRARSSALFPVRSRDRRRSPATGAGRGRAGRPRRGSARPGNLR